MTKLIMTKGLPGSGKSTWARAQVLKAAPGKAVRINKDDMRELLHGGRYHGKNERQVLAARDELIAVFLAKGVDVIVDDTNFNPIHEQRFRDLAASYSAQFEVKDFTDVPLHTCIERDLGRAKSVGPGVIRKMYDEYLRPDPVDPPKHLPGAPDALIVDIDGTLARMNGRGPFEWHRVRQDLPIAPIVDIVKLYRSVGYRIIFVSGRDEVCRQSTREWLFEHLGYWTNQAALHMRPAGDNRKDALVKEEIYRKEIEGEYNIRFVLDDRDQVVEMWRNLGLTCLQVAPGAF